MILYPAINLQNGNCVELVRGDFNQARIYEADPLKQTLTFAQAGATWLHLVDLDGAHGGKIKQLPLIQSIANESHMNLLIGGGIRAREHVAALLGAGAERIIIGSLAIEDPELVKAWLEEFGGDHIVLAMDVRINEEDIPIVQTDGWQTNTNISLWDAMAPYINTNLRTLLCTDVTRHGMLEGPNTSLYKEIKAKSQNLEVIASGGIRHINDLSLLAEADVDGVIIGKALYEGKIDLNRAIQICA